MSETKWGREPWVSEGSLLLDADGEVLGALQIHDYGDTWEARAEVLCRIVACVNACAGIPTEALEAGRLGEALTLLGGILDDADRKAAHGNYGMANALPRDPLVAALRALGRLP